VPALVQSTLPLTGHGARLLLQATVVAFMLSEIGNRVRSARHSGGTRADRGSIVLVVACIAAGLLAAGWAVASSSGVALPGGWWSFSVGIALMWFGIALRQWSVLALGRYFTVAVRVVEDQRVVDSGPYRWVRHPSYTGLLVRRRRREPEIARRVDQCDRRTRHRRSVSIVGTLGIRDARRGGR